MTNHFIWIVVGIIGLSANSFLVAFWMAKDFKWGSVCCAAGAVFSLFSILIKSGAIK